ncbi:hypothetical protein K2Y11_05655 [bacterium]|nr:hypothetical protein [bacterium]
MSVFWILFGLVAQMMFGATVIMLFVFLWGIDISTPFVSRYSRMSDWMLWDLILLSQFAIPHSVLLHPTTKRRLAKRIPGAMYGVFFCAATCISLWVTVLLWKSSTFYVWNLRGTMDRFVHAMLIASWIALFYSISLTGFGYQTGWTTWWAWFRNRKIAPRGFVSHGAYRYLRHPIYLSFMGLIWFNPQMSADRFVLAVVWTMYIFVGSELKDRRLEFYLGDVYRRYRHQVPAYPWNSSPVAMLRVGHHLTAFLRTMFQRKSTA